MKSNSFPFRYQGGRLSVDGHSLDSLAEKHGTPLYVYSETSILKNLAQYHRGFKGTDHLVCYAVKANSNLSIIRLLGEAGAGMDLVSGGELYRVEKAEVPGERVVFSGIGKTPEEMKAALSYRGTGIYSFNVESLPELELLNAVAGQMKRTAPVAIRFNPDVNPKTHPYISTGLKKNKFGLSKQELNSILRNLSQLNHIHLKGISVHIGSQLTSLSPMRDAFRILRDLVNEVSAQLETPIEFVDVGGGLGIQYKNESPPDLKKYAEMVRSFFGPKSRLDHPVKILMEPGRSIVGNAGALVTEVLFRKERKSKDFLIVDAAMNDLLRPSLYGSYHEIVPTLKPKPSTKRKKTDIVGPVCETGDCFASDRMLSRNIQSGEKMAILSAGAYGFTMAGNYNTRPRAAEILVSKGSVRLIRKRETYSQLIQGESE